MNSETDDILHPAMSNHVSYRFLGATVARHQIYGRRPGPTAQQGTHSIVLQRAAEYQLHKLCKNHTAL